MTTRLFSMRSEDRDRLLPTGRFLLVAGWVAFALATLSVLDMVRPHASDGVVLEADQPGRIVVREVAPDAGARAIGRFEALVRDGMPNRFGAQRFGRDGDNALRAQAILRGEVGPGDRRAARFLISALQAAVFNAVLDARELPLHAIESGDVAMRHDSGGSFVVEDVERESARAAAGEVSATGPIVGPRLLAPQGRPGERERRVFERFGVSPESLRPPRGVRLRGARRSLRVFPFDADAAVLPDAITLSFSLPPGSYATVLLDEVLEGGVVSSDGPG